MKKFAEIHDPDSCLNKAKDDELIFVLRAHDPSAPDTIRGWAANRISLGKNTISDPQIVEALACADKMEEQRANGF